MGAYEERLKKIAHGPRWNADALEDVKTALEEVGKVLSDAARESGLVDGATARAATEMFDKYREAAFTNARIIDGIISQIDVANEVVAAAAADVLDTLPDGSIDPKVKAAIVGGASVAIPGLGTIASVGALSWAEGMMSNGREQAAQNALEALATKSGFVADTIDTQREQLVTIGRQDDKRWTPPPPPPGPGPGPGDRIPSPNYPGGPGTIPTPSHPTGSGPSDVAFPPYTPIDVPDGQEPIADPRFPSNPTFPIPDGVVPTPIPDGVVPTSPVYPDPEFTDPSVDGGLDDGVTGGGGPGGSGGSGIPGGGSGFGHGGVGHGSNLGGAGVLGGAGSAAALAGGARIAAGGASGSGLTSAGARGLGAGTLGGSRGVLGGTGVAGPAGSGAGGAGAAGGRPGMGMMGGGAGGAGSSSEEKERRSLGLFAPKLEDDDQAPKIPRGARAGSRKPETE